MAAMPLADVVDDGLFDNNPYDHDAYRETMHCTHSHLQSLEYYQVPRSRVLFNKTESRFYIVDHRWEALGMAERFPPCSKPL
jgi:hypothetical protein